MNTTAEWLGGPLDGLLVIVRSDAEEYAVAFDKKSRIVNNPQAQRYIADPGFWQHDVHKATHHVAIYDIAELPIRGRRKRVILWCETPQQ